MKTLNSLAFVILAAPFAAFAGSVPVRTPEPGTFVLLGTGLAGLGFAAWRKSRKR